MVIELKDLFDAPGNSISFDGDVDLSEAEIWGAKPFKAPVHVSGVLKNRSGIVSLDYSVRMEMEYDCDRCRKATRKTEERSFSHWLARKLEGDNVDDEYILVPGSELQMDELVMEDVTLELPFKLLCSESCKGLCPICGADLNETTCQCQRKQVDPRLESLMKLLDG